MVRNAAVYPQNARVCCFSYPFVVYCDWKGSGLSLNGNESLLPVKSDFVFKIIFGDSRNADILAGFLKSVLDIPDGEYDRVTVVDPHVKKESERDKYGVLDVKVHTKSGNVVHCEIQLWFIPEMKERCVYYQSKMVTEQMASGYDYTKIKRVVSIIITDFIMAPENGFYHNQFRYRSDKDGVEFTNITEIDLLELPKLPSEADNTELWDWMKLIKSDDKEALDVIAGRNPQIKKAVGVLKELSADDRTRLLYEEREKARRDIASMVGGARREGHIDVARNMLAMDLPLDTIVKATGLTRGEIEELQ